MALLTDEEKNRIAEENMQLIHYVANMFRNTRIDYDELYGAAMFGFTKALNSFDTEKGAKFSTYAVNCMKNEIRFFLRKERRQSENSVSYNLVLSTDKNGNDFELYDILVNESLDATEVSELIIQKENRVAVRRAIERLTPIEQYIIRHRYGLDGAEIKTQKQIASEINMSQANVSKIQKNCLKKIEEYLVEEYDDDELAKLQYDEYVS